MKSYSKCIIFVADSARFDELQRHVDSGILPNIKRHIVDRGSLNKGISVFPSTTGPAHIPFVCGVHPGYANIPGYRWLDRSEIDNNGKKSDQIRSLNSPRGLYMGLDMRSGMPSIFDSFDRPSAIIEPADVCNTGPLYRVILDRLLHISYAHNTDDWRAFDWMVEKTIIRRIRAGSDCIVATFLGIDEYSHLSGPYHESVEHAYRRIDAAIGRIVDELKAEQRYDDTVLVLLSDHGHTDTHVHISLVDILHGHRFKPFHFPQRFSRKFDSAVMESGNAMAQLYFRRESGWGKPWTLDEMQNHSKTKRLIGSLLSTEGIPFLIMRDGDNQIIFHGKDGALKAAKVGGGYEVSHVDTPPLAGYPEGRFTRDELFELSFDLEYPDAVDQVFKLFESPRTGDVLISADPGYDLRLRYERPEHRGSHGALHREHMCVPLAISVPLDGKLRRTCDVPPTLLALTGKVIPAAMNGSALAAISRDESQDSETLSNGADRPAKPGQKSSPVSNTAKSKYVSVLTTVGIIVGGLLLTLFYQDEITGAGKFLLITYGQQWMDGVLFAITAISSTPLFLPIWGYVMVGIGMGYTVWHLAAIMALGSATGSLVTYLIGLRFGNSKRIRQRFPELVNHRWARGKSRFMTTMILFLGTASPIPCDVFYAACGLKRFPWLLFWVTLVCGRVVRYLYLGFGFGAVLSSVA